MLQGIGLSIHIESDRGTGYLTLVLHEGPEMLHQCIETMHRRALFQQPGLCLVLGRPGASCRGDGIPLWCLVPQLGIGQGEGSPCLTHMPLDIIGKHADEQVTADPILQSMVNRTNPQMGGLERPEGPFHGTQRLVSANTVLGTHLLLGERGPDHVDAVQLLFLENGGRVALKREGLIGDVEEEVFLHLVAIDAVANPQPNRSCALKRMLEYRGSYLLEQGFGSLQQVLAYLRMAPGERAVVAHQQPFTGKLGMGQLNPVAMIIRMQAPVPLQPSDHAAFQRGNPAEIGMLAQGINMGLGDHSTIAHQHHPGQRELLLQPPHLGHQGLRVGDIARMHRDGYRSTQTIAQQAKVQLELAPLAVPTVTELGQCTTRSLEPGGTQVIQYRIPIGQQSPGQFALNPVLTLAQPVHGGMQFIHFGIGHGIVLGQGRGMPPACGGQLGVGLDDASRDQGTDQIAFPTGRGADQAGYIQQFKGPEHRQYRSMAATAVDAEGLVHGDQGLSVKMSANQVDGLIIQGTELGERSLLYLAVVIDIGLA